MAQTEFQTFLDVYFETNNKTPEIREREEQSLEILPRRQLRQPYPHEQVLYGAERLLPHELLGGHWLEQRKAKWSADYLGLHPIRARE